jgi:hypothetical protein
MSTSFSKPSFAFAPTQNPFLPAPAASAPVAACAVGEASYALVAQGPAVNADELETLASAVEVQVLWGATVLSVAHVTEGKGFIVGEGEGADFVLAAETLGRDRLPRVDASTGAPRVVLPIDATVRVGDAAPQSAADLLAQGRASTAGDRCLALPVLADQSVRVTLAGSEISYVVRGVRAGRAPAAVGFLGALSGAVSKYVGLSLIGHLGVVASLAYFMPSMAADDAESASRENFLLMQKYLNASAPAEQKELPGASTGESTPESGGKGERAQGAEGTMGKSTATTSGRWAFKGESKDPKVQQQTDRELARQFGMVELLTNTAGPSASDPNAPSAKWGAFAAEGADSKSAMGSMWAPSIGDALGGGAFGLSGNEEGGGGSGAGIGLDRVGGLGHGAGGGDGQGFGPGRDGLGNSRGRVNGAHQAKGPNPIRELKTDVNGTLPADVIQRIVRSNFGRFRNCYDAGLRTNPALAGRVVTKFVIGRDGAVTVALNGGSDLPSSEVVSCVVRGFQNLSFPAPAGGQVTVIYPLAFSPAE